jgi:DDE superfamily endonuclease
MRSRQSRRARKHPIQAATPGGDGQLVEHEYDREGALCYLPAWDVRRARIFDRCAPQDGIQPFDQLIEQFMSIEPYSKAQRVFVIVANGSAHRGQRSIDRLQGAWSNLILVHTPVHASWVNQCEIYFSILQRKVLQPTTSPNWAHSSRRCWRSAAGTSGSPNRSSGSSPARISIGCSTASAKPRSPYRPSAPRDPKYV